MSSRAVSYNLNFKLHLNPRILIFKTPNMGDNSGLLSIDTIRQGNMMALQQSS